MRQRRVAIAVFLILATAVLADLSPDVYKNLQKTAPEILSIRVSSVDVHRTFAKPSSCSFFDFEVIRDVKLEARVVRVVRSETGVHASDVIEIEYSSISRCSGWNGPRSIPLLRKGDQVYAFVARRGRTTSFEPAARGATFSVSLPEEWARSQGCTELASDTEADNAASAAAHRALGFEEAAVVRCFRKSL